MQGTISFHPVDPSFFERWIDPLLAGGKIQPQEFLDDASRVRGAAWQARRYAVALEAILNSSGPPELPATGNLWSKVRARLDQLEYKPDELTELVQRLVEPDLHLYGRPFFVAEGSAESVAALVGEYLLAGNGEAAQALALEQLIRLDPTLGREVAPSEDGDPLGDMRYRSLLLAALREIYELAGAARQGTSWARPGTRGGDAQEILARELPWRALALHARLSPFWVARDVDGLETICLAADVPAPPFLRPARAAFATACTRFPQVEAALHTELREPHDVGAWVAPADVPELIAFLGTQGARIIQVASRHGEGPACTTLLRKMRECATYAQRRGFGYLEAAGIGILGAGEDETVLL
ncbi:MAG TPA: hypothetical protein VJS92_00430 [Candidatus Polarisedimenticolaceae bacterium]|nr:hypothetical protein [Candidatus Polarisedimenticolaceae bacterium]